MALLLKKLRLDYSSLTMLSGITNPPKEGTAKFHSKILNGFHPGENDQCFVSDEERIRMHDKTNRQLRLREMLREHSKKANLIVMSMPMPRQVRNFFLLLNYLRIFLILFQGEVSAPLYMSWLEVLSYGMPPMLFVRGNQTSVLTFYS